MKINIKGGQVIGSAFGDNSVVMGNAFGKDSKLTDNVFTADKIEKSRAMLSEEEMLTFAKIGKQVLNKLDPISQEYKILNPAVVYAERKQKDKLLAVLKTQSLEIWKKIFVSVASTGILKWISQWTQ